MRHALALVLFLFGTAAIAQEALDSDAEAAAYAEKACSAMRGILERARASGARHEISNAERSIVKCRKVAIDRFVREREDRLQEAEAARDKEAREAAFEAEPSNQRIAWSALLCYAVDQRSEALAAIAREKRGAKIAGVVDKVLLHNMQNQVLDSQNQEKTARAELKHRKMKPLPCTDVLVGRVSACVDDQICNDGEARDYAGLTQQ